ncbi:MAG: hypothetical protein MOIL_01138 [Candidatus Methanolliviera sp. GoM_oil]|nr:MAG: hypothetical protein MOIL_01138 [Candidatus Methanolliviera sp. GoM_oil]
MIHGNRDKFLKNTGEKNISVQTFEKKRFKPVLNRKNRPI